MNTRPISTLETITPKMAKELLTHNIVNRPLNASRAQQYAKDMKNGLWQINGEGVAIDVDGNLKDGQHRLQAIILANIPVQMFVVRGVSRDTTLYDRGRVRSISDAWIIDGYDPKIYNATSSAMAKLHYAIINNTEKNVSDGTCLKFIQKNEKIIEKVFEISGGGAHGKKGGKVVTRNTVIMTSSFHAIVSGEVSDETIERFLRVVRTGYPETNDDISAITLRNDISCGNVELGRGGHKGRVKSAYQIEKAIYDFNCGYQRKRTYANWETPIYSCMKSVIDCGNVFD